MATNRFTINEKTYTAKPFDFGLVCDLEDLGVQMENLDKTPMSMIRAYLSLCANISKEKASRELQEHVVKGGDIGDIVNAMSKEMDESDFFRSLNSVQTAETTTVQKPKKQTQSKSV